MTVPLTHIGIIYILALIVWFLFCIYSSHHRRKLIAKNIERRLEEIAFTAIVESEALIHNFKEEVKKEVT